MYLVSFRRITLWAYRYQLLKYSLSLRMCEWNWEWKLRVGLNFFSPLCVGLLLRYREIKLQIMHFFHETSTSKALIDLVTQCVDLNLKLN